MPQVTTPGYPCNWASHLRPIPHSGGGRFTSVNPDITFTWLPLWNLQFYGEVYGQSRTGPGLGSGFDADGGVQYLLTPYCEVDLEEGVRLSGNLGGFTHYFGAGMGFLF